MSALREAVEGGGQSLLSVHKRCDGLLLGEEDCFVKLDAVQTILSVLVDALALEDEQKQLVREAFAVLRDPTDRDGILDAAERLRSHDPEKVAEWLAERRRKEMNKPYIPTTDRWGTGEPEADRTPGTNQFGFATPFPPPPGFPGGTS